MAAMSNPAQWLAHIETCETCGNIPRPQGVTPWISGAKSPRRSGWYERIFTDGVFRHFWDGACWKAQRYAGAHWRQVGDYPAWRGLMTPNV